MSTARTMTTASVANENPTDPVRSRDRHHHARYCCHCRSIETDETQLKRCARCKLTIYCSRDCQIQHYKLLHKHSCKSLETLSKESNEYGDFLFQVAYRSNDTPARSTDMMEQVLDAYYNEGLSERSSFLLASLGHYREAMWEIYRGKGCDIVVDDSFMVWNDLLPGETATSWSSAHVLTVAWIKLKLVIAIRDDKPLSRAPKPSDKNNDALLLQEQEHQLQEIIQQQGGEQLLLAIRDSIPLKLNDVPQLFVGCPSEFLLFVQDCFLLEPGMNDLLHEFVREEEYE